MKQSRQPEKIDIREIFRYEVKYFTPWLRERDHIQVLASLLELRIEITDIHSNIGRLQADMVGIDLDSGRQIVIENQLDPADLKHLGQIQAYIANSEADVGIWLATDFQDEFLKALVPC